ncbi:MAG TPA: hypothetical protein VFR61_08425 [Nitrososphaeraceae archaeon]|nr:hypothetical protein [Nitrososphaeraceae archaeon]
MSDAKYDKVKHLVEVEDDILAVFTVALGRENLMENLSIAKNSKITENFVSNIFAKLQANFRNMKEGVESDNISDRLKWTINETDQIRTLIIYEKDRAVIVLIKSNTSLSDTVDNILGYYYESEDTPKNLFRI